MCNFKKESICDLKIILSGIALHEIKSNSKKVKYKNNYIEILKYNNLEFLLEDIYWDDIYNLVDVNSLNGDAYRSSFYIYMDGKNDKIHAGPIWYKV